MRNGITKNKMGIASFILAMLIVLCCIIMLISLFLPFVKATDDLEDVLEGMDTLVDFFEEMELLEDWEDPFQFESLDMEAEDLIHLSIVELERIENSEELGEDNEEVGVCFRMLLVLMVIIPVWMIVMAILKQGMSVLTHNILLVIVFVSYSKMLQVMDLVSKDSYAWSAGFVLYIVCMILIFLASLVLIILKILKTNLLRIYFQQKRQESEDIYQREIAQRQINSEVTVTHRELPPSSATKEADRGSDAVILQIKQYKELADKGIISEEDYNAKKKQLLGI